MGENVSPQVASDFKNICFECSFDIVGCSRQMRISS